MAKIDTTIIEGFDSMDAEAKVNALLGLEIPEHVDMSKFVSKEVNDKNASEAAEYKRKWKAAVDDDTAKREESDKAMKELQTKYDELVKKNAINQHKATLISQGYDEALADETAKALVEGDIAKVLENTAKFKSEFEKQIKDDGLKGMRKPDGAGGEKLPDNVELAKNMGQKKASAASTTEEVMKHYY